MRGLLVRVGIDSTDGDWNAPVRKADGEFAYVTITETKQMRPGLVRRYDEFVPVVARFGQELPGKLLGKATHLDPDFEFLTYGDTGGDHRQRAKQIQELNAGDILVFYAGLRDFGDPKARLAYALIGLYVIRDLFPAASITEKHWRENAHTRRVPGLSEIVVRAKAGFSGRLSRCIQIGEFRNRAYRVKKDVLEQWGGLKVKDGYLQRSGHLPEFKDAEKFYRWFKRMNVRLIRRNNP